jgi:hypothetical protein
MPAFGAVVLVPDFGPVVLAEALVWRGNNNFLTRLANKCVTGLANLSNLVEQCNF